MISTFSLVAGVVAAVVAGIQDDRPALRKDRKVVSELSLLSIDHGHFEIKTPGVDRVVALGPQALGPLIRAMRRADVPLDRFARCYTACDQILLKAGLKTPVHWLGGLIKHEGGNVVRISRYGGYSAEFRGEQVAEIVGRAKEVGLRLDAGR
jgi:hypothetical protein